MKIDKYIPFFAILIIGISLTGCGTALVEAASTTPAAPSPAADTPTATPVPTETPQTVDRLPEKLEKISASNAKEISGLSALAPNFPNYYQISPDGRVGARADLSGVDLIDIANGEVIMHISAEMPDCEYGSDRYVVFNQNGGFVALVTRDALQVWQVGGGQIFTEPYSLEYRTDAATCGADIPQLALSPDGTLLAISGMDYTPTTTQQYFRVVDVLKDQTVYEWDGKEDTLHGDLYPYQGLGFSDDGKVIQTFDPTHYFVSSGKEYESFRFWSVGDWQALGNDSGMLSQSFSPDELTYAVQTDTVLDVRDRQSGRTSVELNGTGCTQADPCDLRFSQKGTYLVMLNDGADSIAFHHDRLNSRLSVWNLADQQMVDQSSVLLRNLDGIQVTDDGQVLDASAQEGTSASNSTWWTSSFNFNGMAEAQDGSIIFTPQRVSLDAAGCYFCGSCSLDPTAMQIDCKSGELAQRDGTLAINVNSDEIVLQPQGSDPVEVALPAGLAEGWDVRVMGYAPTNQTVFYCLDKDQRSQVCHIYAAGSGKTIADPEDIYALRFSDDGSSAAYLNRNQKALYIVNLEKGRLTKIPAYQSRADFVNPVFLSGSTELVYVIQNLNDAELLSLEWVDAGNVNVLRRATLDRDEVGVPESVALNKENDMLAIGAQDGRIYLLDEEKGKLITSWQASDEPIVGLTFARSDNLLVSLDGTGRIEFWGIK